MRIIAMMAVFNESDILETAIQHAISQGIELVVLENESTDGSYETCARYVGHGIAELAQLRTETFDVDFIYSRLYEMALKNGAEWAILNDADELLDSPYRGVKLRDAVTNADRMGYNMIQFNNFEFWPTEQDEHSTEPDVTKRLKYYTWNDDLRFLAWKTYPGVKVVGAGGHYPIFPQNVKIRVPRTKFVMRHYRIRSYEQGVRKVFSERLPRFVPEQRDLGVNVHYDNFRPEKQFFVINSANLHKYNDDGKWIGRKTFDYTRGIKPKHAWPKPPVVRIRERLANMPPVRYAWRAVFLKRKPLPTRANET